MPWGSATIETLLHAGYIDLRHVLGNEIERLSDEGFQFERGFGLWEGEQPIEPHGEIDWNDRELGDEVVQAFELKRSEVLMIESSQNR